MFVFDVNHINRSEYATIETWTGLLAYGILNLTRLCVQVLHYFLSPRESRGPYTGRNQNI